MVRPVGGDARGEGLRAADIQALDQFNPDTAPLSLGKAATSYAHSNQLVAYQAINKDKLALRNHPLIGKDAKGGHYRKPSMFFSVSAQTKTRSLAPNT